MRPRDAAARWTCSPSATAGVLVPLGCSAHSSVPPLSAANLFAFFFSLLCFHIHITMRGEASWQTSITFTHTRTHAKTHARKHSCQQAVCHVSLQIDHEPSARYIHCARMPEEYAITFITPRRQGI